METIKTAIWGNGENTAEAQQNSAKYQQEPASGVAGDVSKGEPYDAGNMTPQTEQTEKPMTSTIPEINSTPRTLPDQQEQHSTPGTHSSSSIPGDGAEDTVSPDQLTGPGPRPIADIARENGGHMPEKRTAMNRGISPAPPTSPSNEDAEGKQSDDGNGGEAGKTDSLTPNWPTGGDAPPRHGSIAAAHAAFEGDPSENQDEMNQDGKHPHTDHHVSSGMASEGGNFDVTKPGAGREAQRLIHQGALEHGDDDDKTKNNKSGGLLHLPTHKKTSNGTENTSGELANSKSKEQEQHQTVQKDTASASSGNSNGGDKPKLSERIKDKLHIGSH